MTKNVLWYSNSPWCTTGYGTQTKQVTTRMLADGHRVAIASNYGLENTQTDWEGLAVLPRGYDGYSTDILPAYYRDWERQNPDAPTVLVTLFDVWVLQNPALHDIPIVSWVPIDHDPIPPKVADWCLRPNVTPVAMSHFGGRQLEALGVEHMVIPHGIDTDLYVPTTHLTANDDSQRTAREWIGVPENVHLTGIVNANKGTSPVRKAFGEQFRAWSAFAQGKDDVMLYLHTESGGGMGGIALEPLLLASGIPPEKVKLVNQYQLRLGVPDDAMAAIYSTLDVLLAATLGEGFGLTVAESGSCGTRSIVQDWTAQPELVVDGWKVSGQPLWDAAQNSWFSTPSIPDMIDALNESYARRDEGPSLKSRQHIIDNYDADTLYRTGWRSLLDIV